MPRKSKREPYLLPHALKAIARLKDDGNATTSKIVNYVYTMLKNSDTKFKEHKLANHVKKALEHGVEVGLFKVKPGRYLLGLQSNFDMNSKESMKDPPDGRKIKQPSATPTTMSFISAGGLSINSHNGSMDEQQPRQNKPSYSNRSSKHKAKRKKRRQPSKDPSVPSGRSTPIPEPPAKKPAVYRSSSRDSNLSMQKKELSSTHHKDHSKMV